MATVGVRTLLPKACDFVGAAAQQHGDDAEALANCDGTIEQGRDLRCLGIGGNIPVAGFVAQQQIADTASGKHSTMPGVEQSLHDLAGASVDVSCPDVAETCHVVADIGRIGYALSQKRCGSANREDGGWMQGR